MKSIKTIFIYFFLFTTIPSLLMANDNNLSVKKPSFISGAGTLNKNEHAVILDADGYLIPPGIMAGYVYGLTDWFNLGIDAGGFKGMFHAIIRMNIELIKSKDERIFWGFNARSGYRYHKAKYAIRLQYDDVSWIFIPETTLALRIGENRDKAIYLKGGGYMDIDLRKPKRQTDYYIQGLLGFENTLTKQVNFYIEGGIMYSLNGMQMYNRKYDIERDNFQIKKRVKYQYKKGWFMVCKLGLAYRFGI